MNKNDSKVDKEEAPQNAVLYLSRFPYGFDGEAAEKFFSQFGSIKGVCFPRSKLTGRSKGYMFLLFEDRQIAEIAAKAMNNYYMFGKTLNCQLLEESNKIHYNKFFKKQKKFKFVNWKKLFSKTFNKNNSDLKLRQKIKKMILDDEKKKEKFAKIGFNLDLFYYKNCISD